MDAEPKPDLFGIASGLALAPLTALGSYVRRSRVFHPCGVCLRGTARAAGATAALHEAGTRLEGPVLVRFSGAWWKRYEWPDVLGCALRFGADGVGPEPRVGDQDLLLATIRTPLTTLLAPLSTHVADYLSNAYFGVSPFRVPPLGQVKLRLVVALASARGSAAANALRDTRRGKRWRGAIGGSTREQRLMSALEREPVRLTLEARAHRLGTRYQRIAEIELVERVQIDEARLRFDPFVAGRDFRPVGFVHALRVASYAASRRARDARA